MDVKFFRPSSSSIPHSTATPGESADSTPAPSSAATSAASSSAEAPATCPTCKTAFTQSTPIFILRRCGHALCQKCIDTLVLAPLKLSVDKLSPPAAAAAAAVPGSKDKETGETTARCAECDKKLKQPIAAQVIRLQREGTGYAASGNAEATKRGIGFQA